MKNKKSTYVAPFISVSSKGQLKDYFNTTQDSAALYFDKTYQWQDLLKTQRTFILGEPGYGKSRLELELYDAFIQEGKACCWLELKHTKGQLLNTLQQYLRTERDERRSIRATATFQLSDSASNVLFLDALDEVHTGYIPPLIDDVEYLAKTYPKLVIFISCRSHHLNRHQSDVYHLNFSCVKLRSFTPWQTAEFLQLNCPSLQSLNHDELLDKLEQTNVYSFSPFANGAQSTLATPRYLEVLAELITTSSLEEVLKLRRAKLFDQIVIKRLKKEAAKHRGGVEQRGLGNKIYYVKQYLERLALVMEMQRVNVVSKDDLVTFNLDTQMNIDQQVALETLFDGTILKDNIDTLEFDNTEFQEYLAAKAMSRLGRPEQLVFDLAIEQRLKKMYPSWVNVVGYLIEIEPTLLSTLIDYARRTEHPEIFALIRFHQTTEATQEVDLNLFSVIFSYYAAHSAYLPVKFEQQLYRFYQQEHHYPLLQSTYRTKHDNDNPLINVIRLLILLLKNNHLSDEEKAEWREELFTVLTDPERNEYIKDEVVKALAQIVNIEDLEPHKALWKQYGKLFRNTWVEAYISIDPNHPKSIEGIVELIARNEFGINTNKIDLISSKAGFLHFFTLVLESKKNVRRGRNYVEAINKNISIYGEETKLFFENLGKIWDSELETLVIRFLLKSIKRYYSKKSEFFDRLWRKFIDVNPQAVFTLLEYLANRDESRAIDIGITDQLGLMIQPQQFAEFHQRAVKLGFSKQSLWYILRFSKQEELRALEREYYPDEYKKAEEDTKKRLHSNSNKKAGAEARQRKDYEIFIEHLNKKSPYIFQHYAHKGEQYEQLMSKSQKKRLVNFSLVFIEKYDPQKSKTKVAGSSTTTYGAVNWMLVALKIAITANQDLQKYRQKLLFSLPFAWQTELIFKAVPNITTSEFDELISWIESRTDDLHISGLRNILELIKTHHITAASDFLMNTVNDSQLNHFRRNTALEILHTWNKEPVSFYQTVFDNNITDIPEEQECKDNGQWSNNYSVALFANEILIQKEVATAIDWRMEQVKAVRYKVRRNFSGCRKGLKEEDLFMPLKYVRDIRFKDKMLEYLEYSFIALVEDEEHFTYVQRQYWDVVINYFCQLKTYKNKLVGFLAEIKKVVKSYAHVRDSYSFSFQLRKVEDEYLSYLSEPEKIAPCIKQYNLYKSKQYLDIVYPRELFELIKDVINQEFRQWVDQGFYSFVGYLQTTANKKVEREMLIQKHLTDKLENLLLKRGLRRSDVREIYPCFYREVEKLDGDKADLIITYGGVGAILIEIKRAGNADLSPKNLSKYREEKLLPYLHQTACDFGIFLIFRDHEKEPVDFEKKIQQVKVVYEDLEEIEVIGIDCVKGGKSSD